MNATNDFLEAIESYREAIRALNEISRFATSENAAPSEWKHHYTVQMINSKKRAIAAGKSLSSLQDSVDANELFELMKSANCDRALEKIDRVKAILQTVDTSDNFATVRLSQCAGIVNRSKRTLERWKTDDMAFPTPDVIGLDGKPDEWKWSNIRPYLMSKLNRKLPERFPTLSR